MAVRIGFIGVGGIAGAHRKSLAQIPNAQMVAFCDSDEARAKAAAEEHGGQAYTDYRKMLADAKLDAVYICLPPCFHGEFEDAVIEAGLPFFIEKPIDVDLARAKATAAKIKAQKLITGAGYHWRHYDSIDWLQAAIGGQAVGLGLGYWIGGTPGVWWWRKWESSGGQMVEQCTHITDLARYLMGKVVSVYAQYHTYRMDQKMGGFEVADAGSATLTFASGAVCQITTSCALEGYGLVGLDVHFGGRVAEIRGGAVTLKGAGVEAFTNKNLINPTVREDTFFVNAVDGVGDPALIRSPYADALKTLEVTLAMNQSAQTGRVVKL